MSRWSSWAPVPSKPTVSTTSTTAIYRHNTIKAGLVLQHTGIAPHSPAWSYNNTIQSSLVVLQQHYTVQLGGLTTALYSPAWWSYNNTIQSSLVSQCSVEKCLCWPQTDGSAWSFRARCGGKRAQRIVTHATKPALRTRHLPLNLPAAIHSGAPPPTPLNSMPTRLEGGGEVREALHRSVFVWTDWLTAASVLSGLTGSRPYQSCLD